MSDLFISIMNENLLKRYRIDSKIIMDIHAKRRLLRSVLGLTHLTLSIRYTTFTGIIVAIDYVSIMDEADHVNTYICPGMSIINMPPSGFYLAFLVIAFTIFYGCAVYKLRAVKIAPLGPNLY